MGVLLEQQLLYWIMIVSIYKATHDAYTYVHRNTCHFVYNKQ